MEAEVDRVTAEQVSLALGVPVSAIPEDFDALTAGLWVSTLGDDEQMPESVATRWDMICQIMRGLF